MSGDGTVDYGVEAHFLNAHKTSAVRREPTTRNLHIHEHLLYEDNVIVHAEKLHSFITQLTYIQSKYLDDTINAGHSDWEAIVIYNLGSHTIQRKSP